MDFRTKENQVADFLREGIISGQFARGARLKQAEIAVTLGLSITPVREALKLLEAEGYVTGRSHHGVTVAPFDPTASAEILDLRVALEDRLTRAAIPLLTDADIAGLHAIQADFEAAVAKGERARVRGINYRFHRLLYATAKRPQTLHFVQILWARYPFDLINSLEDRVTRAVHEHRALMQCVAARDVEGASSAMRAHLTSGWEELQPSLTAR